MNQTYPVDPRVPLRAGDFRPCCSEAEVRTAVAVVLKVGRLFEGELAPIVRELAAGVLALTGPVFVGAEEKAVNCYIIFIPHH